MNGKITVLETGRKKTVIFNDYSYQINKKTSTTIYLRCSAKCGVTMTTDPLFKIVRKYPGFQNHSENKENIDAQQFRKNLKGKIDKDPTQMLKTVYDNILSKTVVNRGF